MPEPLTCSSCNAEIPAGARFCVKCGTAAPAPAAAAPEPPAPEPPAPAPSAPVPPAGSADAVTEVPQGGVAQDAPTQPLVPPGAAVEEPTGARSWESPYGEGVAAGAAAGAATMATPPPAAPQQAPPPQPPGQQPPPGAWTGAPAPAAPPAEAAKPKGSSRNVIAGLVGFLGALAVGVGSFLPWADIDEFRGISGAVVTGWDGLTSGVQDGPFFAAVAVVAGALAASILTTRSSLVQKLLLLLAGVVATGMAVYEISDYLVDVNDINDFGGDASLGYGLWLALAGGVLVLLAGVLAKRTKAEKPEPAPAYGTPPPTSFQAPPPPAGAPG